MHRFLFAILALTTLSTSANATLKPLQLRTEYRVNPLGIDTPKPRFSWIVTSPERGQVQTAYRIIVSSSARNAAEGVGDLWDSGVVPKSDTMQIAYDGKALASNQPVWWRVKVQDKAKVVSLWSPPATFTMGLLDQKEWKAQWIGCEIPRDKVPNATYLPASLVRKPFSTDKPVQRALLHVTALGLYELAIDGKRVTDAVLTPGWTEYAKRIYYQSYDVTASLSKPGKHAIAAMIGDGWYGLHHNGRGRTALLAQLHLWYADGTSQTVLSDGSWKCSYEGPIIDDDIYNGETYDARKEIKGWELAGFNDSSWKPVRVGTGSGGVQGTADVTDVVRSKVKDNSVTLTAGNALFGDPAYNFVKTLQVRYRQNNRNKTVTVAENAVLSIPAEGPLTITKATYGADISSGDPAEARIQNHPGNPVRRTGQFVPGEPKEPKPGHYTFNMGQNFSGWVRLKVKGSAGQRITLKYAEMLNPDGTIYTTNLRAAKCTDTYICKGGGTEIWEPRFTFKGFQYVEITGLTSPPESGIITGVVLNSDAPLTGGWTSSNPLLNKLYQNIVFGQRSNYLEVPTDCPQRDERMGWSGDAQVFIGTGVFNMDIAAFFTAWMNTFNDSQDKDGGYPNVSPKGYGVSPAWGDAGIVCPWTIYHTYGDKRIIEDHWPNMKKWITYLRTRSKNLVRPEEGFGDWLNLKAEMPKTVIATAWFAHSTALMAEMADVIGKPAEAQEYRDLFKAICAAFQKAFVKPDGRIFGDTQTTYLMALGFNLIPESMRPAAEKRLVELIKERNDHISIGFLGVNLILPVLTSAGRTDLAYKLLTTSEYPGWLYSITQGATTIWERWDGWTKEKGFQDPGMNSFNHYAYGSSGEWMFKTAAGIRPLEPGYGKVAIRPTVGGGLTFLKAHYDSIRGRFESEWQTTPTGVEFTVTIPANVNAEVYIPTTRAAQLPEVKGDKSRTVDVRFLRYENGAAVFEAGSGTYKFAVRG